jgi:A/G-specific adenine glycosylase
MINDFTEYIYKNYSFTKRDSLIWRIYNTPYNVFISEIMLQQTQVERVKYHFEKWINIFPDFNSLAHASTENVLHYWQGLGYNRRALFLLESAKIISNTYNGIVPQDKNILKQLPGIGDYTAGALLIFGYNQSETIIETNIRTVYLKYFFENESNVSDKKILPLIEQTIDHKNPRQWYYLLMDAGNYIKKNEKNYNHSSKHYQKQSQFIGSKRQIRAKIIKKLLTEKHILIKDLELLYQRNDLLDIIKSLEKDNMIIIDNNYIQIKSL